MFLNYMGFCRLVNPGIGLSAKKIEFEKCCFTPQLSVFSGCTIIFFGWRCLQDGRLTRPERIHPDPPSRCHLPFDKSFGRLMIPSQTEGLTALSKVEGPFDSASFIFGLSQRNRHLIEARS
jgi:hypothetical protein